MKKILRAIVVDDERLPRLSLLQKLEEFRSRIEVIDSCETYDDALQSILRNKPDLLFMDIQLQGRDAIQLLTELRESIVLPAVIFTTAYTERQYLMSAIKLSAVDYLVKPIDVNQLALAIAKVTNMVGNGRHSLLQGRMTDNSTGKLSFRTANGKVFVEEDEIACFLADGNYATMRTFRGQETVLESLAAIERHLDASLFVRVDRSTIINIRRIYKLNVKRRVCVLQASDGTLLELELSNSAIDTLSRL